MCRARMICTRSIPPPIRDSAAGGSSRFHEADLNESGAGCVAVNSRAAATTAAATARTAPDSPSVMRDSIGLILAAAVDGAAVIIAAIATSAIKALAEVAKPALGRIASHDRGIRVGRVSIV